jgi:carbon storage regulator
LVFFTEGVQMLVLSRKEGERLLIGDAEVTVLGVYGGKVRLGLVAPSNVPILRHEAKDRQGPDRACNGQRRASAA